MVVAVHRPRWPRRAPASGPRAARARAPPPRTVMSSCVGPDAARGEDPVGAAARSRPPRRRRRRRGRGRSGWRGAAPRARAGAAPPTGPFSSTTLAESTSLPTTTRTAVGRRPSGSRSARRDRERSAERANDLPDRFGDVLDGAPRRPPRPPARPARAEPLERLARSSARPAAGTRPPRRSPRSTDAARRRRSATSRRARAGRSSRRASAASRLIASTQAHVAERERPGRRATTSVNRSETTSTPSASFGAISAAKWSSRSAAKRSASAAGSKPARRRRRRRAGASGPGG